MASSSEKIIIPLADKVLDKNWNQATFFRVDGPKYIDFQNGYVYERKEVDIIEEFLKKNRLLHLNGPPSSGKTVLALSVAYQRLRKKHIVLYFNRPSAISDEFLDFIKSNYAQKKFDRKKCLIIVDDVHLSFGKCSKLFSILYNNYNDIRVLFSSRSIKYEEHLEQDDWHFNFKKYMQSLDINANTALEDIANHYSIKKFGRKIPPLIKKMILLECSNDLLLLGRYLSEWNGLSTVNLVKLRQKVFVKIQTDLEKVRIYSDDAVKVLFIISLFYKYEIPIEKIFLSKHLKLKFKDLIKRGDIKIENDFLFLHHSSLAKLYCNTIETQRMREYDEVIKQFSPFPIALFKEYILSEPRNMCELIISMRDSSDLLSSIFADFRLTKVISTKIKHETQLNILGWAIFIMFRVDKKNAWRILEQTDLSINAKINVERSNPNQVALFIFNLFKVSKPKGEQWLQGVPLDLMSNKISKLKIKRFVFCLEQIRHFSNDYFDKLLNTLDLTIVCQKVLEEENLDELKLGISKLSRLLRPRVNVQVHSKVDFTGEWSSTLDFYCENKRVTRVIPGKNLGIPFSSSITQYHDYGEWLINNRYRECNVIIDNGIKDFIVNRQSLFPIGVVEVNGEFEEESIIEIRNCKNKIIGVGIVNYCSDDLKKIKQLQSQEISDNTNISPNRVFDNDRVVRIDIFDKIES